MAQAFSAAVKGGELAGLEAGDGEPLLVLHGGPLTDYTEGLVALLPPGFRTIRYQQRGLPPSTTSGPYDVDTHVGDAIAVLDDRGCDRAWLLGHSWGGHLAFHLTVAHPERVTSVVGVDPLGAVPDGGWAAMDAEIFARLRRLSPNEADRAEELDRKAAMGTATDADFVESLRTAWPCYFADPRSAPAMPDLQLGVELYSTVYRTVHEHFGRGTLERGLPEYRGPFTLIHGDQDPLPTEAVRATSELVPGASLELLAGVGHFPWLEEPEWLRAALARAFGRVA